MTVHPCADCAIFAMIAFRRDGDLITCTAARSLTLGRSISSDERSGAYGCPGTVEPIVELVGSSLSETFHAYRTISTVTTISRIPNTQ